MSANRVFFSPNSLSSQNHNDIMFHSPVRQPHQPRHQNSELDIKSMKQRLDILVKQAESILPPEKRPKVNVFTAVNFTANTQTERPEAKSQQKSRSIRLDTKTLGNFNVKSPLASSVNLKFEQHQSQTHNSNSLFQHHSLHKKQNSSKIIQPFIQEKKVQSENPERSLSKQLFSSDNSYTIKKSYHQEKITNENQNNVQFTKSKPKKEDQRKEEPEISWTKYLSLEFKYEQLQENLKKTKEQLLGQKEKSANIKQELLNAQKQSQQKKNNIIKEFNEKLEHQKEEEKKKLLQKDEKQKLITTNYNEKLQKQKQEYEKKLKEKEEREIMITEDFTHQLQNQKMEYEKKIEDKNEHIRALVDKLSAMEKGAKGEKMNEFIEQILKQNENLVQNLKKSEESESQLLIRCENMSKNMEFLQNSSKAQRKEMETLKLESEKIQKMLISKKTPFEEVIKSQMEESKSIRERLQVVQQENISLKEQINDLQRQMGNLSADHAAIELRQKSLRNKIIAEAGITMSNKDNEIQTLSRKLHTLQEKYKVLVNEIRSKDQFLQQHLVGRTDQLDVKEYIKNVLEKYEEIFRVEDQEEKYLEEIEGLKLKLSLFERNW